MGIINTDMKKIVIVLGCFWMLFLTACKKEVSDDFNLYNGAALNDTTWLKNIVNTNSVHALFDDLKPSVILDSMDVYSGKALKYGDSLEISFNANSCLGPGGAIIPPGGMSMIEIMSLKRKGDLIRTFRPTVTANGYLLESGGGYMIKVLNNGTELTLAQNATFKMKFNDVDSAKGNMQLFYGKEGFPVPPKGFDTSFSWIRDFDTTYLKTWDKQSNNPLVPSYRGYELNSLNLRWVLAEKYLDSTLPKTKVTAILSPNFTNKNTAVFLVFNNQKTVVNLKGDFPSRSFNTSNIPLNASVKLISLSKIGPDYYLGVTNINSVQKVTSYTINPSKSSLSSIINYLNNL